MKSKTARLAALFGLVATMALGGIGTAHATTDPEFGCANLLGAVVCDNAVDYPIDITVVVNDTNILTQPQRHLLEEDLDAAVGAGVGCHQLQLVVIQVYQGEFDVDVVSDNVVVIPCA